MVLGFLTATLFGLAAFDAWLTQRRIQDYGPSVELNKFISTAATLMGPQIAAFLGVMVPTTLWAIFLNYIHNEWFLALLVGYNFKRFEIQHASLAFEKQQKLFVAQLLASKSATLPDDESTSQFEAPSSKDDNESAK